MKKMDARGTRSQANIIAIYKAIVVRYIVSAIGK